MFKIVDERLQFIDMIYNCSKKTSVRIAILRSRNAYY